MRQNIGSNSEIIFATLAHLKCKHADIVDKGVINLTWNIYGFASLQHSNLTCRAALYFYCNYLNPQKYADILAILLLLVVLFEYHNCIYPWMIFLLVFIRCANIGFIIFKIYTNSRLFGLGTSRILRIVGIS
jgi:hypothetical protein